MSEGLRVAHGELDELPYAKQDLVESPDVFVFDLERLRRRHAGRLDPHVRGVGDRHGPLGLGAGESEQVAGFRERENLYLVAVHNDLTGQGFANLPYIVGVERHRLERRDEQRSGELRRDHLDLDLAVEGDPGILPFGAVHLQQMTLVMILGGRHHARVRRPRAPNRDAAARHDSERRHIRGGDSDDARVDVFQERFADPEAEPSSRDRLVHYGLP